MLGRRGFVGATFAAATLPALAKTLPEPSTANIHWPGPNGDLHGYMAIPAKARGRQSSVLVLSVALDDYTRSVVHWLAIAGFVACAPRAPNDLDAAATISWLAGNRYGTGRVAALGFGNDAAMVDRLAATLACGITCGIADGPLSSTPILRLMTLSPDSDYQAALVFLKEHLA